MAVQGILQNINLSTEQVTVLYPYLREVFINETPLVAMLPREKADAVDYKVTLYDVRPRTYTLAAAVASGAATTMTLSDASPLMIGDILQLTKEDGSTYEHVELTADPNTTTNVITVRRARGGTTATTNTLAGNTTMYLIGNSRTGAEIDQNAQRAARSTVAQTVQTFNFPVQVGRVANQVGNTRLPAGFSSVFSLEQQVKITEMMRDEEYSAYYAEYESVAAAGDRAKQRGLRQFIKAYSGGANVKLNGGSNYTKLNFIADTIQKAIDGGGNPDVVLVATNFLTFLSTWSVALQQFQNPRTTPWLGVPIKEFDAPFLGHPVRIIPSYQLRPGTAVALTSSDVKMRYIEQESFAPRGRRGDAVEGDAYADTCIEIGHPGWHAWVEGITSAA